MSNLMRLASLTLLLFSVSVTFAQDAKKDRKARADSSFARISERLKLTTEQQTQLKEVMKQNRSEMKAVREANKDVAKPEKRKAMMEQLKKNDSRVSALLNESQKAEYEKLKAEKKEEMKKKRAEHNRRHDSGGSDDLLDDGLL